LSAETDLYLEDQLRAKLEHTWIESTGYLPEIARSNAGAKGAVLARASKLGVVPGIEALGPELELGAARLADHELLEQREVPVIAARAP